MKLKKAHINKKIFYVHELVKLIYMMSFFEVSTQLDFNLQLSKCYCEDILQVKLKCRAN